MPLKSNKCVFVVGGDGFCGWPTALQFALDDYIVVILDNLSRREIDRELGTQSIVPISDIGTRINIANQLVGEIIFENIDVANDFETLKNLFEKYQPDVIVHFGEQRAAPYSMINSSARRYTVNNNVLGTQNICDAMVETASNGRLVHLGTMGVYGYSAELGSIPEGYLDVTIRETGAQQSILYPMNPGSIYHMTKCLDHQILQFYKKNWNLDVIDLHQGIVWGSQTPLTKRDHRLWNRFDYDGIYGTVLNRFIIQSLIKHPLTVYGLGGQTRALININDTVNCIRLASLADTHSERVTVYNQVAEEKSVLQLAQMVSQLFGSKIKYLENPRKEASQNQLVVKNHGLRSLGFEPILLEDHLIEDVSIIADDFIDRIDKSKILNSPKW
jgi:UDP-sulfoquinovose synthase